MGQPQMLVGINKFSDWKTASVAAEGTTSAAVDLGDDYDKLNVIIPTIDSATVAVHIAETEGGTYYPVHHHDGAGANSLLQVTVAGTGGIAYQFKIGGARFIKIVCGAAQNSGAVAFRVRGCN